MTGMIPVISSNLCCITVMKNVYEDSSALSCGNDQGVKIRALYDSSETRNVEGQTLR